MIIKQTCVCGAQALVYVEASKTWNCGQCVLTSHEQLVTEKVEAESWPPGPAGHDFGPGSVVVAGPGGLLEQMLGVAPG